jgi:hypothetical protein
VEDEDEEEFTPWTLFDAACLVVAVGVGYIAADAFPDYRGPGPVAAGLTFLVECAIQSWWRSL